MERIRFQASQGSMGALLSNIRVFPDRQFSIGFPEAIGDAAHACWPDAFKPEWQESDMGVWTCTARKDAEVSYRMLVMPFEDTVEIHFKVTNESERTWKQSLAFNCFQCGGVPEIRDHECLRHWVRTGGQFKRLTEVPRVFGPRPTVQLYSVEGAPLGTDIPFVAHFKATPDVVLEGWMAIQSRDGKRLVATASKPALFLFQNMEYSCIHSAAGFGPLKPGQTAEAVNRIYFAETTLEAWHKRMQSDFA